MADLNPKSLPLRVRLVAAMLSLVGAGLLASGIAVTSIRRHILIQNIDKTLIDASTGWALEPRHQLPAQGCRALCPGRRDRR